MGINLQNLESQKKGKKRKKRVGRGDGSGHGTYSTRGIKGQRSRSGGKKGLKRRGLRTFLRNVPKKGGFKSLRPKLAIINIQDLEKHFKDGSKITAKDLVKNKLLTIVKIRPGVKVLGQGKMSKKLEIHADAFSKSAFDAIIKVGGKAIKIKKPKKAKSKKSKNTK